MLERPKINLMKKGDVHGNDGSYDEVEEFQIMDFHMFFIVQFFVFSFYYKIISC